MHLTFKGQCIEIQDIKINGKRKKKKKNLTRTATTPEPVELAPKTQKFAYLGT